jgi:hypothetical protein
VYKKQEFNEDNVMWDMMPKRMPMPMARAEAAGAMQPMAAPAAAPIPPRAKRRPGASPVEEEANNP